MNMVSPVESYLQTLANNAEEINLWNYSQLYYTHLSYGGENSFIECGDGRCYMPAFLGSVVAPVVAFSDGGADQFGGLKLGQSERCAAIVGVPVDDGRGEFFLKVVVLNRHGVGSAWHMEDGLGTPKSLVDMGTMTWTQLRERREEIVVAFNNYARGKKMYMMHGAIDVDAEE